MYLGCVGGVGNVVGVVLGVLCVGFLVGFGCGCRIKIEVFIVYYFIFSLMWFWSCGFGFGVYSNCILV